MPRFCFWFLALTLAALVLPTSGSYAASQLRMDLQNKLGERLCRDQNPLEARELWQLGVFDAQLQVAWIDATDPIALPDLEDEARKKADIVQHHGFAFGLCTPLKAWVVSSHAPEPLFRIEGDSILLATSLMRDVCASYDLDAAEAEKGLPRSLQKKSVPLATHLQINPAFLKAGTLSVTCHPPGRTIRGPELWGLMPIGRWDYAQIPFFNAAKLKGSIGLKKWIEHLRASHKLKPLQLDRPILTRFAQELLQESSIRHPRALLLNQASELNKKKGKFLGENRVKASSSSEMAWLLWHSPQHRRLLLNKEANALGLELSRLDLDELAVLVVARL